MIAESAASQPLIYKPGIKDKVSLKPCLKHDLRLLPNSTVSGQVTPGDCKPWTILSETTQEEMPWLKDTA